jgi:CRISPR-associated protein Cas1
MINEFVYCPRLFYYEQVEGVFAESADTIEGSVQHRRVDKEGGSAPSPDAGDTEPVAVRSITLSSEAHRIIAKLDLAEFADGKATPVDYKHGRPMLDGDGAPAAWPADRVQLAAQALVLRANGYRCDEGVVFYQKTRQRVRLVFDEAAIAEAEAAIESAWRTSESSQIPPPLVDSPKCGGCSLVGICMPDETWAAQRDAEARAEQLTLFPEIPGPTRNGKDHARLLVAPRVDRRPLYLNTQGLRVGKSGGVLQVKDKDKLLQEVRIGEVCQINLLGNIQISTQALQTLCEEGTPVCYFSYGGWFYGVTSGLTTKNVFLRKAQFRLSEEEWYCLKVARKLVSGKIRNQRTMLLRNHVEPPARELREMKRLANWSESATSLEELLGIEGAAARCYFSLFSGMIKPRAELIGVPEADEGLSFDFESRNRRPPRDGVNALLSLGYSLLAKDLTVACHAVGFDPMIGFYHQPRHGRPALALDLMEPLRPLIADSAVLSAINTGMISERDLIRAGQAVSLNAQGRKAFFRAYELRMDTLVTHPLFDYRVSYRRLLEIQARLLAKVLEGELPDYPVFVTR